VVIENARFPLESVNLNGVNATRSANEVGGNAWIAPEQEAPDVVRAIDVNNCARSCLHAGGNDLADTGAQFTCQ
jgi:hypothetical protein